MVQTWSSWKRFPDAANSDAVEAPIGPGVYEVRHTLTGRVIAFARLFGKRPLRARVTDLEYRTCAAESRADAKTVAHRLLGLRQTA